MFSRITGVKLQVIASLCSYLGSILGGYAGAWSGPVIPKLRDLEQSPLPYLLTESQLALVGTLTYLGAIPGPYIMTWVSNKRGRKPCLIGAAVVSVLGSIILATSNNLAMIYIGRIIMGGSLGTLNIVNFVYVGEIASPSIRGILLTIMGPFFTLGLIIIYATGSYVSYQGMNYISLALNILLVFGLLLIPESPFFYALQGKDEDAVRVMEDLGRSQDVDELLKIKKELAETNTKKGWIELFSSKSNRKALFIVIVINVLQHSSGVMAVVFFSASIFDMAGSSVDSNLAMVIIGCCQLVGSVVTPFFIESTGRKIILIISSAVCSLSMFALGLYFYLDYIRNPIVDNIKWLPLLILVLFFIGYDFGLSIIPNTIIGEMFTTNLRSKGSTLALTSSWLFGFMVTTAFGALLETVGGHVAFWFFSSVCACAVLFTIFFVPETKGKTLLEIQESLS
ncbi:facilitated trehalose transporter Tret1-like [Maniola hyperantus]|uniref:facilitated trehalose transporter Tret1-like n=1 Tax=Aphantopus hyperantus TaxID=2795564 RepID=UPI002129DCB4